MLNNISVMQYISHFLPGHANRSKVTNNRSVIFIKTKLNNPHTSSFRYFHFQMLRWWSGSMLPIKKKNSLKLVFASFYRASIARITIQFSLPLYMLVHLVQSIKGLCGGEGGIPIHQTCKWFVAFGDPEIIMEKKVKSYKIIWLLHVL